jgi:hypothetical protein
MGSGLESTEMIHRSGGRAVDRGRLEDKKSNIPAGGTINTYADNTPLSGFKYVS